MTKRNITCIDLTNDEESNSFYKDFLTQNRDIWLSKKHLIMNQLVHWLGCKENWVNHMIENF